MTYYLATRDDVSAGIIRGLQTLHFSVNPKQFEARLAECESEREAPTWTAFWTDGIVLDNATLSNVFKSNRKALHLQPSSSITYQIRVVACYRVVDTFASRVVENPNAMRAMVMAGSEKPTTELELKLAVWLFKRAATDAFVRDTSTFNSAPFHDVILRCIMEGCGAAPRSLAIDAAHGGSGA